MKKLIFLNEIKVKDSPCVRAELREETVKEYQGQYALKKHDMPAPVLYLLSDKRLLVADGNHRIAAMKLAGLKAAQCEVVEGSELDCVAYALQSNRSHGVRRSNADKRRCIETALKKFPGTSNKGLAELCHVDDHTVAAVRSELEKTLVVEPAPLRQGSDGKTQPAKQAKVASSGSEIRPSHVEMLSKSKDLPSTNKRTEVDSTGYVVPEKAMRFWKRRDEIQQLLSDIKLVQTDLKGAEEDKDLMFVEVKFAAVQAALSQAYEGLQVAMPHAVCPTCAGKLAESCSLCKGRGLVSKFRYATVPKEILAIRNKAIEERKSK